MKGQRESEKKKVSHEEKGKRVQAVRYPALSKEEINKLPLRRYTGPIHLIARKDDVKEAVAALSEEKILGFDTETRPAFKKGESYPPALLQLATSDAVYIFQLAAVKLPKSIRTLLSNPDIVKAGVGLDFDIKKLQDLSLFEPGGFEDLSAVTDKLGFGSNGLRGLTAAMLGFRISKGAQRSNWSRKKLTSAQLTYAATDAWVSRELYLKTRDLRNRKKAGRGAARQESE